MSSVKKFLFWQPKKDWLRYIERTPFGRKLLIILNYIIWLFFLFLSYLLIKKNINVFGQLLIATIIAEVFERFLKSKVYWRRPLFNRKDKTPVGLVNNWYETGSFPSGHTVKALYFLLFMIQYQVFSVPIFLSIVIPLLSFRVMIGFHYPIDMIGGAITGVLIWFLSKGIIFPESINQMIKIIFDFIFLIRN